MAKLYESKRWLTMQIQVYKKTPEEIAKECGTDKVTIYRWIIKHGLRR